MRSTDKRMTAHHHTSPGFSFISHDEGEADVTREEKANLKNTRKQLLLRLDPAVHAAVAKWAADDLRSVNAQIEVIIRRALQEAGRAPDAAPMRSRGRPRKGE